MKMETMSLLGGKLSYAQGRFKSDKAPLGKKVYFLNENGRDKELESAARQFHKGQVLTVKEIYVGASTSEVEFLEAEKQLFNTVMFADHEESKVESSEKSSFNLSEMALAVHKSSEIMEGIEGTQSLLIDIDRIGIELSTHNSNLNAYLYSETLAEIKRLVIAELTGKIEHDTESLHEILKGGTGK